MIALVGSQSDLGEPVLLVETDGGDTDLLGDPEQFAGDNDRSWKYVGEADVTFFSSSSDLRVFPSALMRLETPREVAMSVSGESLCAGT